MTRGSRGRLTLVVGIIILTLANISVWKHNPKAEGSEAGISSPMEGQSAFNKAEEDPKTIISDDDFDEGQKPPDVQAEVKRRPIQTKPTTTTINPQAAVLGKLGWIEVETKINVGGDEIRDLPRWGEWEMEPPRRRQVDGSQEFMGQEGVPGVSPLEEDQIDFDGIRKGSQPDTYMRIFGNALQTGAESRKAPPVDFSSMRKNYKVPEIERTKLINCKAVLDGDKAELKKAQKVMEDNPKIPIMEETYQQWFQDCEKFKKDRGFVMVPLTVEEENYPLAFSIAMFTDVEQTERLLRAIYQPQNLYCIHIDVKAPLIIHRTVYQMTSCFENVFIAAHLDKIKWGDVSVLLPAINCMRDMVKYHRGKWKYFINLTGQEMPLRTNWELVQIAKILNGSNDIGGSRKRMEMDRVNYRWSHRWSKRYQQTVFYNTFKQKEPDSWNMTFYKGELHGVFSHKMVEYITESEVGVGYLKWCWTTGHPTEHYWNVLNYNKHLKAPGGFDGPDDVAHNYSLSQIARAKHWVKITYGDRQCEGTVVRGICVYGVGDLPWLNTRPELVANKFYLLSQYLAYDCLEERHRNRTMMKDKVPFDAKFYRNLPTVKYGRKDGL